MKSQNVQTVTATGNYEDLRDDYKYKHVLNCRFTVAWRGRVFISHEAESDFV